MITQIRGFTEIFHENINRNYKKHNVKYLATGMENRVFPVSCHVVKLKHQMLYRRRRARKKFLVNVRAR